MIPFVLLTGCAPAAMGNAPLEPAADASPIRIPPPAPTANSPDTKTWETLTDAQGSVTFEVTPITLSSSGEALTFEVVMNTHSVDLAWDLAAQGVLRTNDGREVKGLTWPVGSGHHYAGRLTFPARTADGAPLLEGAETLTLILRDADVPERQFTWEVTP